MMKPFYFNAHGRANCDQGHGEFMTLHEPTARSATFLYERQHSASY